MPNDGKLQQLLSSGYSVLASFEGIRKQHGELPSGSSREIEVRIQKGKSKQLVVDLVGRE